MAQSFVFRHLGTAEGLLSDLRLVMTEDKLGRIWIGSDEGINIFDGYQLSTYNQPDSTVMNTNSIQQIYCDSHGTIWVITPSGIEYKKENDNRFRKLAQDTASSARALFFGETKNGNLLIAGHDNCYELTSKGQLIKLQGFEKLYQQYKFLLSFEQFNGDEWLLGFRTKLVLVNVREQKVIRELPLTNIWCADKVNDSIIITGSFVNDTIALVNIKTGISYPINDWPCSDGRRIGGFAGSVKKVGNKKFAIACRYYGVYILDLDKQTALALQHDPADPSSLKAHACRRLFVTKSGTLFIQSRGLSYAQLNTPQFKSQKYVTNAAGEKYDAGFTSVVQDHKNNFWVGTNKHLALWNRKNNTAVYYPYYYGKAGSQKYRTIRTVVTDKLDRVWVGTFGGGLGMLLPNGDYEKFTRSARNPDYSLPNAEIHSIAKDRDQNFIICTNIGFVRFNPVTKKGEAFINHPKLKTIAKSTTYYALADSKDNWWLAQYSGLYYYNRQTDSLHKIVIPGQPDKKQIQVVATDSSGFIYAGGTEGLYIISPVTLSVQKIVGKKDGLASNTIMGLLCDKTGMMWILGNIGAARYNPVTGSVESFDARDGMDQSNHTLCNFYMARDGEVFLTSAEGLNYFYPDKIIPEKKPLTIFITAIELKDSTISMPGAVDYSFRYFQNNLSFSYLSVDFKLGASIQYRYYLKGFDTGFVYAGKERNARYTNLAPGNYIFFAEASTNGKDWYAAEDPFHFRIKEAFWKTWWFLLLLSIFFAAVMAGIFYSRVKKIRKEEALKRDFESKIAQVRMNLLRTQMNPHFLFNSLNSINSFILKNDRQNASGYLTKFSRLMRLILDNSRNEWVTLDSELRSIELYVQLEALRFNDSFEYTIDIDPAIDAENILLPPMLIQPYIENAIWHGLMYNKNPGGLLAVRILESKGTLRVHIKDNGVGRQAATALKSKSALQEKSYGMKITAERMNSVNEIYNIHAEAVVTDLIDASGNAAGTAVLLTLDKIVNAK